MIYSTTSWSLDNSPWSKEERSSICYFTCIFALGISKTNKQITTTKQPNQDKKQCKLSCVLHIQGLLSQFFQIWFLLKTQHLPGTQLAGRCLWSPGFCALSRFLGHRDPAGLFEKASHWTARQAVDLRPFAHSNLLLPKHRKEVALPRQPITTRVHSFHAISTQVYSKHTKTSFQIYMIQRTLILRSA